MLTGNDLHYKVQIGCWLLFTHVREESWVLKGLISGCDQALSRSGTGFVSACPRERFLAKSDPHTSTEAMNMPRELFFNRRLLKITPQNQSISSLGKITILRTSLGVLYIKMEDASFWGAWRLREIGCIVCSLNSTQPLFGFCAAIVVLAQYYDSSEIKATL